MPPSPNTAELEKLKSRIQALRAKTIDNGCTEDEALSAAAKVAELLDRHDLSLSDVELREEQCERAEFAAGRRKRIPIDQCVGAVAEFCDCRVWREKTASGELRYVFFGLRADVAVAHYLTELIDGAVRSELGRYKTSHEYLRFRHNERHMANSSFALGMVTSIADRLIAMKAERDGVNRSNGRDLVIVKSAMVAEELARLDLNLRTVRTTRRLVSTTAFDAGSAAGSALAVNPGIGATAAPRVRRRG